MVLVIVVVVVGVADVVEVEEAMKSQEGPQRTPLVWRMPYLVVWRLPSLVWLRSKSGPLSSLWGRREAGWRRRRCLC